MQTKPCRLTKGLPRERETLVSERGRERETVGTRDDIIGSNTLVVIVLAERGSDPAVSCPYLAWNSLF